MTFDPKETMPSQAVIRGLRWILRQAEADFEVASGQKGTGIFDGTTEAEVEQAFTFLRGYIKSGSFSSGKNKRAYE